MSYIFRGSQGLLWLTSVSPLDYIPSRNPHTLFLSPSDDSEVINIISNIKNSSPGWDEIPLKVLRNVMQYLITPIVHIINTSLHSGIVPFEMKIASIIPLYKSGDNTLYNNYRPTSIHPAISKILEKVFAKRLTDFRNRHEIF